MVKTAYELGLAENFRRDIYKIGQEIFVELNNSMRRDYRPNLKKLPSGESYPLEKEYLFKIKKPEGAQVFCAEANLKLDYKIVNEKKRSVHPKRKITVLLNTAFKDYNPNPNYWSFNLLILVDNDIKVMEQIVVREKGMYTKEDLEKARKVAFTKLLEELEKINPPS